ncbi:hypothetical protein GQ53DRAFT_461698 [Thozetella sp. PMI_491]|nr:hypothetical protein GQ53DRAFT_461698 [Thozetella sp. PMI_491]
MAAHDPTAPRRGRASCMLLGKSGVGRWCHKRRLPLSPSHRTARPKFGRPPHLVRRPDRGTSSANSQGRPRMQGSGGCAYEVLTESACIEATHLGLPHHAASNAVPSTSSSSHPRSWRSSNLHLPHVSRILGSRLSAGDDPASRSIFIPSSHGSMFLARFMHYALPTSRRCAVWRGVPQARPEAFLDGRRALGAPPLGGAGVLFHVPRPM